MEEGWIPGRAFPDQALIIAPNNFTTQLETYKKYFSASSEEVSCSLSYHNDVREYLSVYAQPTVSQLKLFAGYTHAYLQGQTELLGNLQERLYFTKVHVAEERTAHNMQGLRFATELAKTWWEVIKLQQNLDKVVNTLALNLLSCIGLSEEQVSSNMYKLAKLEKQVPAIGAKLIDLQDTVQETLKLETKCLKASASLMSGLAMSTGLLRTLQEL